MAARPKLRDMDHQRWAREEARARRPVAFQHRCAVCQEPAAYGFGSFKDADGLWSCRAHRADVETMVERT